MQNFNWTTFTKKIAVKESLFIAYDAWTKAGEIEKWFLKSAKYFDLHSNLIAQHESVETSYTYEWSWFLFDDYIEKGNIIYANGKDSIRFTFAGQCIVEVKLSQQHNHVVVELTQSNIPTDDQSKQSVRLACASGWSFYLLNLKSVYEGGIDLRNRNAEFQGMVNN